jgi:hypothetical protein
MRKWFLTLLITPGMLSSAFAQFASDRPLTPPGAPSTTPATAPATPSQPGTLPSFPTPGAAPAQPKANPVQQASYLTQQMQPGVAPAVQTHAWSAKPEHGGWMLCVKSYSGPNSQKLAEELATIIRTQYRTQCFLFEWGSEDRQREMERRKYVQEQLQREQAPFLQVQKEMKERAAAEGKVFIDTPLKVRMGKVDYPEQWAVLIGGFKDMDTARKALDTIRTWPVPKADHLLDRAVITRPGENNQAGSAEGVYVNPFASSMVVPNPSIRRTDQSQSVDPALVKLNEEEPMSLLKAKGKVTLMVKGFTMQSVTRQREEERSVMDKIFSKGGPDSSEQLDATAKQARALAQSLRTPEMHRSINMAGPKLGISPRPVESFVLHIRNGSIVTVGQFDSPEDPALLEMQRLLQWTEFRFEYKDGRPPETKRLFDNVYPMAIPRVQ